jgi:hypothetical protein
VRLLAVDSSWRWPCAVAVGAAAVVAAAVVVAVAAVVVVVVAAAAAVVEAQELGGLTDY